MKKIMVVVLAALLLALPVQPASAAADFSLVNGQMTAGDEVLMRDIYLFKAFFENVEIAAAYSSGQDKYALAGEKSLEGTVESETSGVTVSYLLQCTGNVSGAYDPLTGGFDGTFHYEQNETAQGGGLGATYQSLVMDGELTAIASPEDASVTMTFHGTGDFFMIGTKDVFFTVTFAVQGAVPFTQLEPTEEPEEIEEPEETPQSTPATTKLIDLGAFFSELSGEVEILIPIGYDSSGEPIYNEEAWDSAEFYSKLPEGTKIKTGRNSSASVNVPFIVGTFTMKPESILIVKVNVIEVEKGNWWVNFKNAVRDGSMNVECSQAIAGARGTTFALEEDGVTSTLKVIEGTVEFTSKATGESVMVEGGETVSATADGLGEIGEFDVDAEMADWAEYGAKMPSEGFPLWAILAIGGGAALIAVIVLIAAVSSRKKRKIAAAAHPACAQGAYPSPAQGTYPHPPAQGVYPPPAQSARPASQSGFCTQCGASLSPGAAFCAKCGNKTKV